MRSRGSHNDVAEKLFQAGLGPNPFPYSPYGRRPQLSDLWPCDQEKYRRMADAVISAPDEPLL